MQVRLLTLPVALLSDIESSIFKPFFNSNITWLVIKTTKEQRENWKNFIYWISCFWFSDSLKFAILVSKSNWFMELVQQFYWFNHVYDGSNPDGSHNLTNNLSEKFPRCFQKFSLRQLKNVLWSSDFDFLLIKYTFSTKYTWYTTG